RTGAAPAPRSRSVTVVLVDNQELIRRALTQSLSAAGLGVVGEAQTAEEGIQLVIDVRPDVVLTDVVLSRGSGVEMIQRLSVLAPASRILVLTGTEERERV